MGVDMTQAKAKKSEKHPVKATTTTTKKQSRDEKGNDRKNRK